MIGVQCFAFCAEGETTWNSQLTDILDGMLCALQGFCLLPEPLRALQLPHVLSVLA